MRRLDGSALLRLHDPGLRRRPRTRRRPDAAYPGAGGLACGNLAAERRDDFAQVIFHGEEENGGAPDQDGREESERGDLTHN